MADYSSYFNFGTTPQLIANKGTQDKYLGGGGGLVDIVYNTVGQDPVAASKAKKQADLFNGMMAGYDAQSSAYTNQLQTIYNSYGQYAKDYGAKAQPIIDALTGDITQMSSYIKDYGKNLGEIKDTMMNGINVDPSATRTREQYQGNVAAQYGKANEQMGQSMSSQGLNPYSNTGATRSAGLAEAAKMSDAGNQAYSDWRSQYNKDVQAKQQGMAQYAGLLSNQGAMQGSLMQGRGSQISATKSIMDANLQAGQAQAAGIEGLASVAEARRQEQLKLGQQGQENAATQADITQQLNAKLSPWDKRRAAGIGTDYTL